MTHLLYSQLRRKAFLARWSKLDWSKQDIELAEETCLSRERIRLIRQQLGAPKSTRHRRQRKSLASLQWAKDNLDKFKGLSAAEVRRKYGLGRYWLTRPLRQFLRPFLRNGMRIRKHRWDLMNFSLPDRDLERIWRLATNMARAYRWRKRLPSSLWRIKPGTADIKWSGRGQLQAYRRAVKAEEQKATRYFAEASVALIPQSPSTMAPRQDPLKAWSLRESA